MAHTPGTTARVQRLTSLVAIVLVATAVGLAFGRVYLGHGITYRLIGVAVLSGAAARVTARTIDANGVRSETSVRVGVAVARQ